jgi:hypothetical protein
MLSAEKAISRAVMSNGFWRSCIRIIRAKHAPFVSLLSFEHGINVLLLAMRKARI